MRFFRSGLAIWAGHMLYIYSTIYNSYTAAGESVWGPGVFWGVYYKGSQYVLASPVAGTELSLFISCVLFTVAQWDCGSSTPVSLADDIKRPFKFFFCRLVNMK